MARTPAHRSDGFVPACSRHAAPSAPSTAWREEAETLTCAERSSGNTSTGIGRSRPLGESLLPQRATDLSDPALTSDRLHAGRQSALSRADVALDVAGGTAHPAVEIPERDRARIGRGARDRPRFRERARNKVAKESLNFVGPGLDAATGGGGAPSIARPVSTTSLGSKGLPEAAGRRREHNDAYPDRHMARRSVQVRRPRRVRLRRSWVSCRRQPWIRSGAH
jgi:hypothetical protein